MPGIARRPYIVPPHRDRIGVEETETPTKGEAKMTQATTNDFKAIGKTARIGRFTAEVIDDAYAGEPLVEFKTEDGRAFGSIRISAAKSPVAVDLYESAEVRLGLPLAFDISDYCLTDTEMGELAEWANAITA